MELNSKAFPSGASIPRKHTCDGDNLSPYLSWQGAPQETMSLALILEDPDAPSGVFVHWILFDIPAAFSELREGVHGVGKLGANSYRKLSYNGPCPPRGPAHRYFFKIYALDQLLRLSPGATKAEVEAAMRGHILDQAQLMGRYAR